MNDLFIYPYKAESHSARALRDGLKARLIRLQNSKFKGEGKTVINWGNSNMTESLESAIVINDPLKVENATNKLSFFQTVDGQVSIPPYTTINIVARTWIDEGQTVVVREKLTGNSGEGIVLLTSVEEWEDYNHEKAKLYVKYIPKKQEYRIHVFRGEVFVKQRKARDTNIPRELCNFKIRNHSGGFIFARNEDHEFPECVLDEAINAVKVCELDFGAVDIIYNEYRDKAYVLEINTAPGLEGETLQDYVNKFSEVVKADKEYGKGSIKTTTELRYEMIGGNNPFAEPRAMRAHNHFDHVQGNYQRLEEVIKDFNLDFNPR